MATNLGRVAINPAGAYSVATQYEKLDVVSDAATCASYMYINNTPTTGTALSNASYWMPLASQNANVIDLVYPVGSIYLTFSSTNPGTTFGVGTWVQTSQGRVLIGQYASDTDFDTSGETGGSKTATLAAANSPWKMAVSEAENCSLAIDSGGPFADRCIVTGNTATAFSIVPQYMVCYIFYRTA
jgi:hypothetical protein